MSTVTKKGLAEEVEKLKYDKRLQHQNVARGRFAAGELEKYLQSLPDLASNVEHLTLGQSGHDAGSHGETHQ